MTLSDAVLSLLAVPVVLASGYLALLALLAGRLRAPAPGREARFDVVVPAHDEEAGIADTVKSLLALDYPRERYRVVVVADNCTDRTAEAATAAGARVLTRVDAQRRGKGYALAHAFETLGAEAVADAFVVVDADTLVSPNLLGAFAARLAAGAQALQAEYGVRNPAASWRTRLAHLAFTLFHDVRSSARERLRLSCGLRGNGMGFTRALLAQVPHDAFSVVEDLEYGIRLGLAGHRVHYVAEARVVGEMAASEEASRSQRERWEGGRLQIARRFAGPLLARALRQRSAVLLDLALDVLVPPLSYVVLAAVGGLCASGAGLAFGLRTWLASGLFAVAVLGLVVYVARGLVSSGLGWQGVADLLRAPFFVAWKVALLLRRGGAARRGEWVRTKRENRPS